MTRLLFDLITEHDPVSVPPLKDGDETRWEMRLDYTLAGHLCLRIYRYRPGQPRMRRVWSLWYSIGRIFSLWLET